MFLYTRKSALWGALCAVIVLALGCATVGHQVQTPALNSKDSGADKERELIRVLTSNAPPGEKAIACKRLAIYGTKDAVPALAALLKDPSLASWARIGLEAIPDPAADDALRKAMGKLNGRLLVGTINSIGYRRDTKAVKGLEKKLEASDTEVASAAAVALGRIGGDAAAAVLERALARAKPAVRPAVAEGTVRCAEGFLVAGKMAEAMKLYDLVRAADVPEQRVLEATRGAILARGSAGLPLLLEQLRSADKALFGIGLRTARELAGIEVTQALAGELSRCSPERQTFVLLALADRSDAAVLPSVLEAAKSGPKKLQLAAVGVLDRRGDPASLPVLLELAAGGDAELGQAALAAVARLPGNGMDADLLTRLSQSSGAMRRVLLDLAGQRRIEAALPAMVESAGDADAEVRAAAVKALGVLGGDKQAAELARLLPKTQSTKERDAIETALISIGGRAGGSCVPTLLPLAHSEDSALRTIGLHALASAGGAEALAAVNAALEDSNESVQDEAVRTLSDWPNNWPEDASVGEPLLALARSERKPSHQMLGLRGYLQWVKLDKQLKDGEKVQKVNDLTPLLKRPEEKRLAIAAIDAIPTAATLDLLTTFAAEPAIAEDASSALLGLADKDKKGFSKEQRRTALQIVLKESKNEATTKKAKVMLNGMK